MEKVLSLASHAFVWLTGVVAGLWAGIHGSLPLITAESAVDELHPLLLLPDVYYPVMAVIGMGFAVLLRKAADRVV